MRLPSSTRAIVFLCTVLCAVSGTARSQRFNSALRIATSADPSSINVADLNGDGHPDVLYGISTNTTESSTGSIHTLLWQQGNSYTAGPVLTLPTDTNTLCRAGDLNGDGIVDLLCPSVVTNGSSPATVSMVFFRGLGDGSFGPPVYTSIPQVPVVLTYPLISTFGDINGDGHMDVLVYDVQTTMNYVLLGDGTGHFSFKNTFTDTSELSILLDVNGDKKLDIVSYAGPTVQLGRGDGTFTAVTPTGAATGYLGCTYGDLDGDGRPDAACTYSASSGPSLRVLHGNGDGTFSSSPLYDSSGKIPSGFAQLSNVLAIQDVNRDGIPDIMGASVDGWAIMVGQPGGGYAAPQHFDAGYLPYTIAPSQLYPSYAIEDMDGDSYTDMVMAGPNAVQISYGQADGGLKAPKASAVVEPGAFLGHVAVGDFNGDKIPDVVATGGKNVTISFGKGDGTFSAPVALPNGITDFSTPDSTSSASILAGDFDGDGKQDIIATGLAAVADYEQYFFRGHGEGTFASPVMIVSGAPLFRGMNSPVVDVNGDGAGDILSISTSFKTADPTHIYFSLGGTGGQFNTVSTLVPTDPLNASVRQANGVPRLADFDGDGSLDVVYTTQSNAYILHGNGDGTFAPASVTKVPLPFTGASVYGTPVITTGDFDGDGKQDFAALFSLIANGDTTPSQSAIVVFYGNGDRSFTQGTAQTYSRIYTDIYGVDLNGDHRSEVALIGSSLFNSNLVVGIFHGAENRTLGPEAQYNAGQGAEAIIVDLNGDGLPDILASNYFEQSVPGDAVTVLLNLGVVTGTLTANLEPSTAQQAFTVTAALTSPSPSPSTLQGNVSFTIDGVGAGQAAVTNNAATITVSTPLSIGKHALSAMWTGDTKYDGVSLAGTHTVIAAATTTVLTSSANPSVIGDPVTFTAQVNGMRAQVPSGSVTFRDGTTVLSVVTTPVSPAAGTTSSATYTFTATGLAFGSHAITATYSGDTNTTGSSASLTQLVQGTGTTTMMLTVGPNPAYESQTVTLTAALTTDSRIVLSPSGTVQFFDGANPLGTSVITNNTATFSTTSFAVGKHTITAQYTGDRTYTGATAGPVIETILPSNMMLTSSLNSFSVQTQHHITFTLKATSIGSFTDTMTFTTTGLPDHATVTFSPASGSLGAGSSMSTSVYLDTSDVLGYESKVVRADGKRTTLAAFVGIGALPFVLLLASRKRHYAGALMMLALGLLSIGLSGCSGKYPDSVAPGTYTLHLIATGKNTGQIKTLDLTWNVTSQTDSEQ